LIDEIEAYTAPYYDKLEGVRWMTFTIFTLSS